MALPRRRFPKQPVQPTATFPNYDELLKTSERQSALAREMGSTARQMIEKAVQMRERAPVSFYLKTSLETA